MVLNKSGILAVLLMVIVAGSVRAEGAKEVVVSSAKELKGIKAKKIIWKKDGAKMVRIPSMAFKHEKTFNRVGDLITKTTKFPGPDSAPFYMDATEVTIAQFKRFLKSTDHPFTGKQWVEVYKRSPMDNYPMIFVTRFDVMAYVKWTGKRLPTEAEWEFAARGGLVGKDFIWDEDDLDPINKPNRFEIELRSLFFIEILNGIAREYGNFKGVGGNDKWVKCAPVGSFRPNGYGLFDMVGNVWEECQNWYDSDQEAYAIRGGSWISLVESEKDLGVTNRIDGYPSSATNDGGFRCVVGSK